MLQYIHMRAIQFASLCALILAVLLLSALGACTTTTTTNGTTTTTVTVAMTPAQIAAQANTVLAAFKAGVAAYAAANPAAVTTSMQANVTMAENSASALISTIAGANVGTAAQDALAVANGLAAVASQIPGLPIEATAGLIAFQVLVAALEPVTSPTGAVIAGALLPTASITTVRQIPMGVKMRVYLVPNH
jgi:hypothetical protein